MCSVASLRFYAIKPVLVLVVVTLMVGCWDKKEPVHQQKQIEQESEQQSVVKDVSESLIEIESPVLEYNPEEGQSLRMEFTWHPKIKSFEINEDQPINIDLNNRLTTIEVNDVSKLSLNTDYTIPNENINVSCVCFGLLSALEDYKNLDGTIRFDEINISNCEFSLTLMGELDEIMKFKKDTFFNEEINISQNSGEF